MIPESKDIKKGGKADAIAEIIKFKDKEVRRVLLWSRRQLHKEALARQLRYSIYEAQWMETLWQPAQGIGVEDAKRYQAFFYVGDAKLLRTAWAQLSDRRRKELVHFDRGMQQRDLMEALLQAFGYAPRFLAACHTFLTARETYQLTGLPQLGCVLCPCASTALSMNLTRCTWQRQFSDTLSDGSKGRQTKVILCHRKARCAFPQTSSPF